MGVLRLILALAVVLGHGAGYPEMIFLNGNAAVFCFFIISGFYMALLLDTSYARRPFAFYINRFLRLYPAYFAVLIASIIYREFSTGGITQFFFSQAFHKFLAVISNTLFLGMDALRGFAAKEYGWPADWRMVPQAWSLDVEIMFYLLVPWIIYYPSSKLLIRFAPILIVTLLMWQFCDELLTFIPFVTLSKYIVFFSAGAIAYLGYRYLCSKPEQGRLWAQIGIVMGAIIVSCAYYFNVQDDNFKVLGNLYLGSKNLSLYLAMTIWIPFLFISTKDNQIDRYIGELSYAVYLLHWLVIRVMTDAGLMDYQWRSTLGVLAVTLLAAWCIRYFIEIPVERYRSRIRNVDANTAKSQL